MGLFVDIKNAFTKNVNVKENAVINAIKQTGKAIKNTATRTADVVIEETKTLKTEVIGESKATRLERDNAELQAKMAEMSSATQELIDKMQQLIGAKQQSN